MKERYKDKYGIKSNRLRNWDYSSKGSYFITICTRDRERYFGEIYNRKMILNHSGNIINDIWNYIPEQFQDIKLDEFIIMPNHIHGIIIVETPFMASHIKNNEEILNEKYIKNDREIVNIKNIENNREIVNIKNI
ncbi:MAG: hypothetical protein P8Y04_08470 [Desulfobulbaceae bacterium]